MNEELNHMLLHWANAYFRRVRRSGRRIANLLGERAAPIEFWRLVIGDFHLPI
jgi:hypothetical protein